MTGRTYMRGDIVYIDKSPVAEVGSEMHTARPGVIVSNDTLNITSPVVTVVFLTTKPKTNMPSHVTIESTGRTSTAICEQINTISKERISGYNCACTADEMKQIDAAIRASLDIEAPRDTNAGGGTLTASAQTPPLKANCAFTKNYTKNCLKG